MLVKDRYDSYICTNCKTSFYIDDNNNIKLNGYVITYCPYCEGKTKFERNGFFQSNDDLLIDYFDENKLNRMKRLGHYYFDSVDIYAGDEKRGKVLMLEHNTFSPLITFDENDVPSLSKKQYLEILKNVLCREKEYNNFLLYSFCDGSDYDYWKDDGNYITVSVEIPIKNLDKIKMKEVNDAMLEFTNEIGYKLKEISPALGRKYFEEVNNSH